MKYKDKHDIRLIDFIELNESEKFNSEEPIDKVEEIIRIFNPDSIEGFAEALNKPIKPKWFWRRKDFRFRKAGEFVDKDTLLTEGDQLGFLKVTIPKWIQFFINIDNISLATAEHYAELFTKAHPRLKRFTPISIIRL